MLVFAGLLQAAPLMPSPHPTYPLSRAKAAKLAGTVYANIVAAEDRGELHPITDASGRRWHNKAEVERLAMRIHEKATRRLEGVSMASLTSEQAAKIVELLEEGFRPAEVAIRLRLHIGAVKRIWLDWADTDYDAILEVKRIEAVKLEIERARARIRNESYAEYRDFRIKEKELSAQIARDMRRAEELRAIREPERADAQSPALSVLVPLAPADPKGGPSRAA